MSEFCLYQLRIANHRLGLQVEAETKQEEEVQSLEMNEKCKRLHLNLKFEMHLRFVNN